MEGVRGAKLDQMDSIVVVTSSSLFLPDPTNPHQGPLSLPSWILAAMPRSTGQKNPPLPLVSSEGRETVGAWPSRERGGGGWGGGITAERERDHQLGSHKDTGKRRKGRHSSFFFGEFLLILQGIVIYGLYCVYF